MTTWRLTYKTVIYYAVPFIFFNVTFFLLYDVYDLCYYLDMILAWHLPSLPKALFCCFVAFFAGRSSLNMYGVYVNVKRVQAHLDEVAKYKYSVGYDGEQDTGKTFSMTYDGVFLAPLKYDDLKFNYYLAYPYRDEILNRGDKFSKALFLAREESVEFYEKHSDRIPCLYANYNVYQGNKKAYNLKRDHIIMERRLPEAAVGCADEFANMFGNENRRKADPKDDVNNINEANTFASLHRQYCEFTLLSNDQRLGEIFNGFRTTMGLRKHLETKEDRYSPWLLTKIRDGIASKIKKAGKKNTKKRSAFYLKIEDLCNRIGFLKIGYRKETGIVGNEKKDKELLYYSLGKDINFKYLHRGEMINYPAISKKF